jgi:two-component system nitrogen regulation sensor histidine kinase GlnL
LLERDASPADAELAHLIREEADRIVALIDRMEMFTAIGRSSAAAVNIHRVLEHTRRVAESGFAAGCPLVELYDPSLPPVFGNRDLLIQLFMNLMKNAPRRPRRGGGHHADDALSARRSRRGAGWRRHPLQLPLVVTVEDNGAGIPDDLRPHLFDPS